MSGAENDKIPPKVENQEVPKEGTAEKQGITQDNARTNTAEGQQIYADAQKNKSMPNDFKGKNGQDATIHDDKGNDITSAGEKKNSGDGKTSANDPKGDQKNGEPIKGASDSTFEGGSAKYGGQFDEAEGKKNNATPKDLNNKASDQQNSDITNGGDQQGPKALTDNSGNKINTDGNGSKNITDASGNQVTKDAQGNVNTSDASGNKIDANNDGSKTVTDSQGNKATKDAQGNVNTSDASGNKIDANNDGSKTVTDSTGNEAKRDAQGNVNTTDASGNKIDASTDGSKTVTDAIDLEA